MHPFLSCAAEQISEVTTLKHAIPVKRGEEFRVIDVKALFPLDTWASTRISCLEGHGDRRLQQYGRITARRDFQCQTPSKLLDRTTLAILGLTGLGFA